MLFPFLSSLLLAGALWLLLLGVAKDWIHSRDRIPDALSLAVAWISLAALGVPAFFLWFIHPLAGWTLSLALGFGLGWRIWHRRRRWRQCFPFKPEDRTQLLLICGIALLYTGYLHWDSRPLPSAELAANRFTTGLPIDNRLPAMLAEQLAAGEPSRVLHHDWLSSDRPPLQTGVLLLFRPVLTSLGEDPQTASQAFGLLLQLTWVPAVWALGRRLGLSIRGATAVVVALTFTATPVIHSIYVWPKLFAAGATIIAGLLYFGDATRPAFRVQTSALAAGAAWLAHGSSAFPLLILGFAFLLRPRPERSVGLRVIVLLGAMLLPWMLYQNVFAPPANRLLKWHLAGVEAVDDRPTLTALQDAYGELSPAEIRQHKAANLRYPFYFGISHWLHWPTPALQTDRYRSFYFLFASLGPWNLAWPLVLGWAGWNLRNRLRRRPTSPPVPFDALLLLAAATYLVWSLLLFGPATTMLHQGSLALPLVLSTLLAAAAWHTHPAIFALLSGWQLLIFVRVWLAPVVPPPADASPPVVAGLLLALGTALLVLPLAQVKWPFNWGRSHRYGPA